MLGVSADHPHYTFPLNDLTFVADLFYRSLYFHFLVLLGPSLIGVEGLPLWSYFTLKVILPRVRS